MEVQRWVDRNIESLPHAKKPSQIARDEVDGARRAGEERWRPLNRVATSDRAHASVDAQCGAAVAWLGAFIPFGRLLTSSLLGQTLLRRRESLRWMTWTPR